MLMASLMCVHVLGLSSGLGVPMVVGVSSFYHCYDWFVWSDDFVDYCLFVGSCGSLIINWFVSSALVMGYKSCYWCWSLLYSVFLLYSSRNNLCMLLLLVPWCHYYPMYSYTLVMVIPSVILGACYGPGVDMVFG